MARVYIPPGFTLYQADQPLAQIEIPNDAVTTEKILNANVTTAKLADDSVTAAKMGYGRDIFIPVTSGTEMNVQSYYPCARCDGVNDRAWIAFYAPNDFSSLTEAVVIVIPKATQASADWDLYTTYAANGQAQGTHSANETSTTYGVTNLQLYEIDISGLLTSLAAGDYVGVQFLQTGDGHDADVLGVRIKYS